MPPRDTTDELASHDPLASVGLRVLHRPADKAGGDWESGTMPLVMRALEPAPDHTLPEYRYDPVRQVAVGPDGEPLLPNLKKEWTTIPETHTDGDGGDNENWHWEEV